MSSDKTLPHAHSAPRVYTAFYSSIEPHYVEFDILDHGGVMDTLTELCTEWFDIANCLEGTYPPSDQWNDLYTLISLYAKKQCPLSSLNIRLILQDSNGSCKLRMYRNLGHQSEPEILYTTVFDKRQWANFEEALLTMGLEMILRKSVIVREYNLGSTHYRVESIDESHCMYVKDKSIDGLIAGLTAVGYSLDRADHVNLPCHPK